MRIPVLVSWCLAGALAAAEPAPAAAPVTPEAQFNAYLLAVRNNDPQAFFALMSPTQQANAENHWVAQVRSNIQGEPTVDAALTMLLAPNAVEQLAALATPFLAQVRPQELAGHVSEIAGFLALSAKQGQAGVAGVDYVALHDYLTDVAAWVPKAGLNDAVKLKQAIAFLVDAVKASGLTATADLRTLSLKDLLVKLAPLTAKLKAALKSYDIDLDALIASVTITPLEAAPVPPTPDKATLAVRFTTFGKPHTVPVKVVRRNDAWQIADGVDSPLAGLTQLVMMAMFMNNLGGDGAPAQPAPAPAGGNPL
jgi:hypothetical protein